MRGGGLDREITLQRYGTTYNEWNKPVSGWTDLGKRWASKEDVCDGEKVRAAQMGASVSARFCVRYHALTKTLTAADRPVCERIKYQISGTKKRRPPALD